MYKLLLIRIKGRLLKIDEFQMSFDLIVNSREQASVEVASTITNRICSLLPKCPCVLCEWRK